MLRPPARQELVVRPEQSKQSGPKRAPVLQYDLPTCACAKAAAAAAPPLPMGGGPPVADEARDAVWLRISASMSPLTWSSSFCCSDAAESASALAAATPSRSAAASARALSRSARVAASCSTSD